MAAKNVGGLAPEWNERRRGEVKGRDDPVELGHLAKVGGYPRKGARDAGLLDVWNIGESK